MNVALQPSPQNMELENLEAISWHSFTREEPLVPGILGLGSDQLAGKDQSLASGSLECSSRRVCGHNLTCVSLSWSVKCTL